MDQNVKTIKKVQVQRVIKALERNQIQGYYVESRDEVTAKVQEILQEGFSVVVGGSETLKETGVLEHLRSGRYTFYDRYAPGLTGEQINDIHRKGFSADAMLCSCNAITMRGEIYNVDGNGNRVAAMIFGPKKVIIIAGVNKIVPDLEAAVERVQTIAAPANAERLKTDTPCRNYGQCAHCHEKDRICCSYVTIAFQRDPERMHVILVGEELGY